MFIRPLFAAILGSAIPVSIASAQTTFTGDGDWLDPGLWDGGIPADGSTATVNGDCVISENIVPTQTANPSRVNIGDGAEGTLTVAGGTLSGAHGGGNGVWVGLNGGTGTLVVEEGATYRSQGANMRVAIGDDFGGSGTVTVAGELQIYKFLEVFNGTLELLPTANCRKFNSNDPSFVGANGTLAYVIDGANVGTLARSNATGLQMTLDPDSNLDITLQGEFAIDDSWVLLDYTVLSGEFAQGASFVNSQGYTFEIDYGAGASDVVTATLVSDEDRPRIDSFVANPESISSGASSTLTWDVANLETLTLDPGEIDVTGQAMAMVSPTRTTTYVLSAELDGVLVSREVTVVVDELPVINSFTASDALIAPGEATTLNWDVSGAVGVTVAPAPGSVGAIGSGEVTPAETTTYTLTATNGVGSVDAELTVVVDAIDAAIVHQFDAAAEGQTSGAFLDGVGSTNIDMTDGMHVTGISTPNTVFTAAMDRVNQDANTGGDAGDGFPVMPATFEVWVSMALLDDRPQVVFETGGPSDGTSLLISESEIRLLHSTGGLTTIDLAVAAAQLNTDADALQVTVTLDQAAGRADLYAKGAGGGEVRASEQGELGASNARASLFVWSGFGGAADGALGGTANGIPEGVTSLKGSVHLFNVYDRALSADEVQQAFERYVVEAPEGDADGDGLPDFWELTYFENVEGQGPADNDDGDALDNAAELAAGTDPTKADTDGDTLNDDVEINADPPTDPREVDTDADLLTDGEEVNGAVPSNPTLADTDADTFWDVFEIDNGSDPNNPGSTPGSDAVGVPTNANHRAGGFASMSELFPGADVEDAAFRVCADFSEKTEGERELIFESGGATVGISLSYEAGSELVCRAAGNGGNTVATVRYPLSAAQLAAGFLDIVFHYDVLDDGGQSTIALFVDGAEVGAESADLGGDWTGTNGATFAAASGNFAGAGDNTALTGIAPENVIVDLRKGLIFYQGALFTPPSAPLAITAVVFDLEGGEATVTWDSTPGLFYQIWETTDLENWFEVSDGIPSQGTSTTVTTAPPNLGNADFFLRVQEE